MSLTRLQDDLLNDFREQKQTIVDQIELLDPLAATLHKRAASRLAGKGTLIAMEALCYLLCAGAIVFTVFMNLIPPFGPLVNVRYLHSPEDLGLLTEAEYFSIAVHSIGVLVALLFFVIARMTGNIRRKNAILRLAAGSTRLIMGQHLRRRAAIEAIEQRHFLDLPSYAGSVSANATATTGYTNDHL